MFVEVKRDENAKSCETRLREREGGAPTTGDGGLVDGIPHTYSTTGLEINSRDCRRDEKLRNCEIAKKGRERVETTLPETRSSLAQIVGSTLLSTTTGSTSFGRRWIPLN